MIKEYSAMTLVFVLLCSLYAGDTADMEKNLRQDRSLVVAGLGAEKIILGMAEGDILRAYSTSEYTVSQPGKSEFFEKVLKIESDMRIEFDRIMYFAAEKFAVFISRGKVCAITGFSANRVTIDGVSLDRGADYFIYSYGNKGIKVIKKGSNVLYLYSSLGICIADDDADGDIDMYAVFEKTPEPLLK